MTMHAQPMSYSETLHAAAIARRQRLGLAPRAPVIPANLVRLSLPPPSPRDVKDMGDVTLVPDAAPQIRVADLTLDQLRDGDANRLWDRRFMKKHQIAVMQAVAKHYGISYHEIPTASRSPNVTAARFVSVYAVMISYKHMGRQWAGRLFKRDHSTILHSVRRVRDNIDRYEKPLRDALRAIEAFYDER